MEAPFKNNRPPLWWETGVVNFETEAWLEEEIRLAWLAPFLILDCLIQRMPIGSVGMNGQLPGRFHG